MTSNLNTSPTTQKIKFSIKHLIENGHERVKIIWHT